MVDLTFGEQVKIVLSRKGMTIKELAEMIESETGKKMSRQNLTQRLGRDNFQEQDMRMIAGILGCSFKLSILDEEKEEAAVQAETEKVETPQEKSVQPETKEREMTIGEVMDMLNVPTEPEKEEKAEEVKEEVSEASEDETTARDLPYEDQAYEESVIIEENPEAEVKEPVIAETAKEEPEVEPVKEEPKSEPVKAEPVVETVREEPVKKKEKEDDFQPIRQRVDEEEDRQNGDVNPYTGREYQSNSVRMHPKRIGYVQVYDRKEHKWTDMTEWAFLGYEERKKAMYGKDYEPPIYLD